jgi:Na+-translocating ferredoxin:NAD+ oxidoreductase RnfA subunit
MVHVKKIGADFVTVPLTETTEFVVLDQKELQHLLDRECLRGLALGFFATLAFVVIIFEVI